jgi:hypothetical protein
MKTFYALLIVALFTTAACKKKDEAAKTGDMKTDPAAKTTDTAKTDTAATPDPAKADMAKTDTAAGGGMSVDEAGAKMTALMEKVGTAVTSANGDCAKMGANLKPLTGEVKTLVEQSKSIEKDPAKQKELETKYGDKVKKQMESWGPAAQKCQDNAEVKAFFDSMG